jgi:hypothetical protein
VPCLATTLGIRKSGPETKTTIPMRKSILLLVVLSSFARLATANDIEPGKQTYTATHLTGAVTVDGNLKDWAGVPVLADPKFAVPKSSSTNGTYVLFEPYSGGTWSGPDDQTSAVQVAWDSDNVYFGFVVTDDYHENMSGGAWDGDSIQLMIADSTLAQQVALYNYALLGYEDATGKFVADPNAADPSNPTLVHHEAGPGGDDACGCATVAFISRDSVNHKTFYEIKLPAGALGLTAPLTAGTQFGLGMAINDGDGVVVDGTSYGQGSGQQGQKGWGGLGAHAIVFGKTPSETALITLGTNTPGVDRIFLSAVNPNFSSFSFRATDKGTSVVDPASAKLTLDNNVVTLTSKKTGDATDFSFTYPAKLQAGSEHSYSIVVKDTQGNSVVDQGTFKLATPIFPTADLPSPKVVNKAWSTRWIFGPDAIADLTSALNEINSVGKAGATDVSVDSTTETIDYGTGGYFANEFPYPDAVVGNAAWTGDNYVLLAVGNLDVPAEADYTFGVHSDDGFGMRIRGGQVVSVGGSGAIDIADAETVTEAAATGDSNTRAVYHLKKGVYRIEFVYFEVGGGDFSEVYAVKGAFVNDADTDQWKLVGDNASTDALHFTDAAVTTAPSTPAKATVTRSSNNLVIQWTPTGGTLETTSSLSGTPTWTPVGTANPATITIGNASAFYRIRQ